MRGLMSRDLGLWQENVQSYEAARMCRIADMDRLRDILARHSLLDAWAKFEKRFLQP
jgi:hypothetical protein